VVTHIRPGPAFGMGTAVPPSCIDILPYVFMAGPGSTLVQTKIQKCSGVLTLCRLVNSYRYFE
jgi:hypothetical protein